MSQDKMIQDILEIVTFIKDNAATRAEVQEMGQEIRKELYATEGRLERKISAVSEEITRTRSELTEQIDHFITLHQKLEIELTAMRAKYERLEQLVYKMAKQLNIEVTA